MKTIFIDPIVNELVNRGCVATYLPDTNVVIVSQQKKEVYFIDGYTPLVPYNLGLILSNKQIVKYILLDTHIPINDGIVCPPSNLHELRHSVAEGKLAYPLFIRQENSQLTTKAIGPLENAQELEVAYLTLSQTKQLLMIESYQPGIELRVFVNAAGFFNILTRQHSNTEQLFVASQTGNATTQKLCDVTSQYLTPELQKIAKKILKIFKPMPYASFRVIFAPKTTNPYTVTEVFHSAKPHYAYSAHKGKKTVSVLDFISTQIIQNYLEDAPSKTPSVV